MAEDSPWRMADGWTLYYSRNRSRPTCVCRSSVISDRGPATPFRPTIPRSLKSSQFVSRWNRVQSSPNLLVGFPRNDRRKRSIACIRFTRVSRKTRERFPPEGIETILDRITPRIRYDGWIANISIDFLEEVGRWRKIYARIHWALCRNDSKKGYVIFRVLEQSSKMDRSVRGWKIILFRTKFHRDYK